MPSLSLNRDISILYRLALFGQIMLRANTLRNRAPGFKREKLEKHISGLQKRCRSCSKTLAVARQGEVIPPRRPARRRSQPIVATAIVSHTPLA
jgi:hypothetical protein